jgi:hypothetical protein
MAKKGRRVQQALKGRKANLDQLGLWESKVKKVRAVQRVRKDLKGLRVQEVLKDQLDLKAHGARQALRVPKERLGKMVRMGTLESEACLVHEAPLGLKVHVVYMVHQAHQVMRDPEVLLVRSGRRAKWGTKESKDLREKSANLVSLVLLERMERMGSQVKRAQGGRRGQRVSQGGRALKVAPARKVPRARLVPRVQRASLVHLAKTAPLEPREHQVEASLDLKVQLARRGRREHLARRGLKDLQVRKDHEARPVCRGHQGKWVSLVR